MFSGHYLDLKNQGDIIKHVTQNPYISFDYIEGVFKVFHLKHKEQERLLNNQNWLKRLLSHCEHYEIQYRFWDKEKHLPDILARMKEREIKLNKEQQDILTTIINDVVGTSHAQYGKLNEELSNHGYPYEIVSIKETKKEERDKVYWIVIEK